MQGYENWKKPYRTSSPASPYTCWGMQKEQIALHPSYSGSQGHNKEQQAGAEGQD